MIPDRVAAAARIEGLVALADVVKASDEDLAWLYPDESLDAVAERWLAAGASLVVVTRGGDGSVAWARSGRVDVPSPTGSTWSTRWVPAMPTCPDSSSRCTSRASSTRGIATGFARSTQARCSD